VSAQTFNHKVMFIGGPKHRQIQDVEFKRKSGYPVQNVYLHAEVRDVGVDVLSPYEVFPPAMTFVYVYRTLSLGSKWCHAFVLKEISEDALKVYLAEPWLLNEASRIAMYK
jgi:hypothetical protein